MWAERNFDSEKPVQKLSVWVLNAAEIKGPPDDPHTIDTKEQKQLTTVYVSNLLVEAVDPHRIILFGKPGLNLKNR